MKRVYALGFIFLDVVLGQGAGAAIPGSAIHCLRSTAAECDSGDVVCLCSACKRKERIAELSSCIKKGCKPDEVVPAEDSYGPLYVRADGAKIGLEGPSSTTAGANAPVNPAGQGAPIVKSSATAKKVMKTSSIEVDMSTEEVMSTEVHWQDVGTTSTDDTATSTSTDPVKAGVAASASTARAVSETTASTSTESSTASSTSTEEEQATDTVLPASDKYLPRGGLSAGAKAGIGVGVALSCRGDLAHQTKEDCCRCIRNGCDACSISEITKSFQSAGRGGRD